ncbi:protein STRICTOSIDINE SYNTHASE-LIKE 10-like [Zingiber officinale]|nr:protein STRICTOSIDINE SYNTHASE-LIKE 10-like [Zingiber officinale]
MDDASITLPIFSSVILLLFYLPSSSSSSSSSYPYEVKCMLQIERLELTATVGPESLIFDHLGRGPYTGVSDGRILLWHGHSQGWSTFAVNSANKNRACYGGGVVEESECGRPLGLQFHWATGVLYVADAYLGLLAVGAEGGVARRIADGADGVPFNFTNGVDVDQSTGEVYFTDSSTQYQRPDYLLCVLTGDSTGRLLKYDPIRKNVVVLKDSLPFPNGVALSDDNTFLVYAETGSCRIIKYWLRGPMAGATTVFADLPGYPDNIRRNSRGEFWVAINREKIDLNHQVYFKTTTQAVKQIMAIKLSREGKLLEVLLNEDDTFVASEANEHNGTIWIGSVENPYVQVYKF